MATRVTLPPLADAITDNTHDAPAAMPGEVATGAVPVAKVQLLNDRGDRRAEADWLRAAARPGVATLLSTTEDPFTIVTAHAGASTMRTARLDPGAGLALLAKTAQLLADLHHDGFVHGKLTVDHVIVGPSGPVLCSPDGTVTDTAADLQGVARCMRELGRQWDEADASATWRASWDALAERLEDGSDPSLSALRIAQALQRLERAAPTTSTPPTTPIRRHTGLLVGAALAACFAAGLALVPSGSDTHPGGPEVRIDGVTYAVGSLGDDVVALDTACDPEAPVLVLRPTTGEVWAFASVGDGAQAMPIAVVPGATDLRAEHRGACEVAVARGPAGATEIDTQALFGEATAGS